MGGRSQGDRAKSCRAAASGPISLPAPGRAPTLSDVPSKESHSYTPVLNQWQGPVGDEAIRAVIDVARERIPDGSDLGFSDPRALLQYLRDPRRQST